MPADSGSGKKWGLKLKKMKDNDSEHRWLLWMHWSIRLVLGITFIWAGLQKMADPQDFAKIIYGYGVFPGISINFMAIFLPYVEALAGLCLVAGILPRSALLIINGLLIGFILLIGFNLFRGHVFDCGCFSVSDTRAPSSAWSLLVRDLLLLCAGFLLYFKAGKGFADE
jgi:uncharacterized membrane protein YphA (DoxX/SURF4 family)